jgi:hypothetical protein
MMPTSIPKSFQFCVSMLTCAWCCTGCCVDITCVNVSITCNFLQSVRQRFNSWSMTSFIFLCCSVESTPFYLIFLFWLPFGYVSE